MEIHQRYDRNTTLLHIMCREGCPKSVDILLRLGIDFMIQDYKGRTAKDYAIKMLGRCSDEAYYEHIIDSINFYEISDIKEPDY